MGMNYYLRDISEEQEDIHIGKSSFGWCFSLHVSRPNYETIDNLPESLDGWISLFLNNKYMIVDECNNKIDSAEMIKRITERCNSLGTKRHPIDKYCIGHGDGPWDLMVGEFS